MIFHEKITVEIPAKVFCCSSTQLLKEIQKGGNYAASQWCFSRENFFWDELPNYLVLGNMSLQRIFTLGIEGHFCRRKQNLAAISNCKIVKLCRVV